MASLNYYNVIITLLASAGIMGIVVSRQLGPIIKLNIFFYTSGSIGILSLK